MTRRSRANLPGHRLRAGLAVLLVAPLLLTACGEGWSQGAAGDCGYAFVFEQPIANSTAEQTMKQGLEQAEKTHSVDIEIIDGSGLPQVADNLRSVADKGCYEAIGTAFFSVGESLTQVAQEYPDQNFFILGGEAEGDNVSNYTVANEEGTYVAGAMAAALSKTKTIGIVIGDTSPPLKRFSAGFKAGAESTDPNVTVIESAVGEFNDSAKAGAVASSQAAQDADVIYAAAGANLNIYFQARGKDYQIIASDLADYQAAQSRDPAVAFIAAEAGDKEAELAIGAFVAGKAEPGANVLGLEDGVFTIPYITDDGTKDYELPADVVASGRKAYEDVKAGVEIPAS